MSKLSFMLTTNRWNARHFPQAKGSAYAYARLLNYSYEMGHLTLAEQRKFIRDLRNAADKLERELTRLAT